MASAVKLPRLGQGMEAGTVVKWLKSEGDRVEKGDLLYELDTEKVTQEVEAEASGVLLKIVVSEGEAAVGTTIAFIGEEGETVAAPEEGAPTAEAPPEQPEPEPEAPSDAAVAPPPERREGERIKASPLARRLAREQGIDIASVNGTGPEGRIVAEDVERATAAPAAAPAPPPPSAPPGEVERVPLTSIRRTIARRLTEAWEIPVFHLQASADMTAVNSHLERRRTLEPDLHLTVTDVLVKVCATALMRHPEVNAQYTDEAILRFPAANVGIAVATERGLVVPVVHGAERLSLAEIAASRSDIVGRAREGHLRREDIEGGTFTISNLGMFRVERFTAVLNPPEAAILAVGAIEDRVVPQDGELVVRPTMTFVGTFDHRAVDGAPAAQFLEAVKAMLEDLSLAL
ncbi:MAG TPA: dihydrolipoamide acetyltransferase family protein [Gaiellaceae bacterium]|nr:dihydrolipoamide acetyltransferase family protein [Gaiellaceae bacterium]